MIDLIEGSSIDPAIVAQVRSHVKASERVMVVLDSNHTHAHVREELHLYAPLVAVGSYIVATDGIMEQVAGGPRTKADWSWNNPRRAALDFAAQQSDFSLEEPPWPFNEGMADRRVSYWPDAFLRRIR